MVASEILFKTRSIASLAKTSELATLRRDIQRSRYAAVLTHYGEVLGFLLSKCPETVPVATQSTAAFTIQNLKLQVLQDWQQFDCVDLTLHTRSIAVFVPVKHQGWLPIPIVKMTK